MRILAAVGPERSPTLPGTSHPARHVSPCLCGRPCPACARGASEMPVLWSVVGAGRGAVWVCPQKVCVPLCLCVQACVHACVPWAGLHVAVCTHVSPCTHASVYTCVCVCTCVPVYMCTCASVCVFGGPQAWTGVETRQAFWAELGTLYGPLSVKVEPGPLPSPSAQGSILRAGKKRLPCPSQPLWGSWAGCLQWAG